MNVQVTECGPPENESWRAVVSWVYERSGPSAEPNLPGAEEFRYVARAGGEPAGACSVYDLPMARGGDDLRCGGVAAVATLVQYRNSGVADALMRHVLADMRDKGFAVSALYAFRESYYRRFGHETTGWRWQVKCPRERLPKVASELPVRQIAPDEVASLDQAYLPFIRQRSGSVVRTESAWKARMGTRKPSVYAVGDPAEGYLWANFEGFWGEVDIGEMAWSTWEGYLGCLGVVRSLCSNQNGAQWCEPPDSPYLARFLDQGAVCSVHRASMFRTVDVVRAVSSIKSRDTGGFTFELHDPVCDWNHGTWAVRFGPKGTEIVRGGKPDFRIGIGGFTQALMGSPSLTENMRFGDGEVLNRGGFEEAVRLFTPMPVVCMDFF